MPPTTDTPSPGRYPEEALALLDISRLARRVLEPGLAGFTQGAPDSGGSCLYASFLLNELLARYADVQARVRGGDGALNEDAKGKDGRWHGHYWVEVGRDTGRCVIDITADQFGYPPIRILLGAQADALYRPGSQAVVDAAVLQLVAALPC